MGVNIGPGRADRISAAARILPPFHARIHQGVAFSVSLVDAALGAGADLDMLIRVSGGAHVQLAASVGADAQIFLFGGPTTSADGSALGVRNRNRFSSTVATTLAFSGPTVTGTGTQLSTAIMPGGAQGQTPGTSGEGFDEWDLNPGDFLFRLTNLSAQATPASLQINFYEP